eukprot:4838233-Karenia_brevis.AAC.1
MKDFDSQAFDPGHAAPTRSEFFFVDATGHRSPAQFDAAHFESLHTTPASTTCLKDFNSQKSQSEATHTHRSSLSTPS